MNRRTALRSFGLAAFAGGARSESTMLPDEGLFASNPEAWWSRLRKEQFVLPEWRAFLNTGTLGVMAKPVLQTTIEHLTRSAELNVDELPRWGGEELDAMRSEFAAFYGCRKEEFAFSHNTTDGMNTICNGLDLKAGDEVLLTDQEHPGGTCCWLQKQSRFGIQVREAKIPIPPKSPEDIADRVIAAVGPRTRVLSMSGITTKTGLILPVRRICEAARAKGVLTAVDGAHMPGQVPVDLHELGCDFFAGSPHKWMFTPVGCGFLYVRDEVQDRLWGNVVTYNWDNHKIGAARFQMRGTNNRAVLEGHLAALRFFRQVGPERIYQRAHALAREAYRKAAGLPDVEMLTPDDDRQFAGMVTFLARRLNADRFWKRVAEKRIWLPRMENVRISTHLHTRPSDLDLVFGILRESMT
ncbi:MAG: aminotransferase class V-fold PLP-dependent enzyme [Bryobacteraceae bacterium]